MDQYNRNTSNDNAITEAYNNAKKNNRTTLIIFLLIVVVVLIYSGTTNSVSVASECDDQVLGVAVDQEYSIFIEYGDIISVEYADSHDFGTKLEGLEADNASVGRYENEKYGEYLCMCQNKVEEYIIVVHKGGVLVFNYPSKDLTQQRYNILTEKLAQFGG